MDFSAIVASLAGFVVLVAAFFLIPIKRTQLRVLVAVVGGLLGYFIAYRFMK